MDSIDYPVFTVTEGKLLPNVVIPSEVRGNYESIVERMFGWGEANLLDYVHVVEKALKVKFRSLDWGAEGLEHLTLEGGQSAGLDLEGWKYVPHNIDNPTHAFALGSVAQKFVSMLLGRV